MNRNSTFTAIVWLPGMALFLGCLIYLVYRTEEIQIYQWARALGMESFLLSIRPDRIPQTGRGLSWVIYSLPNGLWAFAYATYISLVWIRHAHWIRYLWLGSIPLLVLGFELLQLPGHIPGTFSIPDLIMGFLGSVSGLYLVIKTKRKKNHETTYA